MHNGIFYTLDDVVDFYDRGGGDAKWPNKSALVKPLGLNAAEKKDLVAFLEALSMDQPLLMDAPDLPPYQPLKNPQ